MNQNPTVDNDLQKAIDDITNSTNQDPVFADPVAAPSSVPDGDDGTLAEPVGPFPEPKPMPAPVQPLPQPQPAETVASSVISDFSIPSINTEEVAQTTIAETTPAGEPANLSIREVKTAALRDLAPLVGKINMPSSQKFKIYRDMFENLGDYKVIEPAYQAAKEIEDETERAEALLYLIQSIDNM